MVELVEYALVVLASGLFAGASLTVYGGYSSFAATVRFRAAFASVLGVAWGAVQNGSASGQVRLDSGSLSCQGGNFTMTTTQASASAQLPVGCSFRVAYPAGERTLAFSRDGSGLTVEVS